MSNHAGSIAIAIRKARQAGYLDDVTDEQVEAMTVADLIEKVTPVRDEVSDDPAQLAQDISRW